MTLQTLVLPDDFTTADLHLGHHNIIGYSGRPYPDADSMNVGLIANWNDTVPVDATVWILGDIALGKIAETLPLVGLLNGRKILVPGNHDRCWMGHKKIGTWRERYLDAGIDEIIDGPIEAVINGVPITMAHFPYVGDSHEVDRYVQHRPVDNGGFLLHGHVHEAWKVRGRMVNVGVDVWNYRPVRVADAVSLFVSATT